MDIKKRNMKIVIKIFNQVILLLFFIIIVLLTIGSWIQTCDIINIETTVYLKDSIFKHFFIFAFITIIISFIKSKKFDNKNYINKIDKKIFLCIFLFLLIMWIACTQIPPVADQDSVLRIAESLHNGDVEEYLEYVGRYHNQLGLVFILYYLQYIFGPYNYIALQLMNVIAIWIIIYSFSKMFRELFSRDESKVFDIFIICFIPMYFYVIFIYGNLWGLAFSLCAILMEYKYLKLGNFRYIFLSAVFITLAIIIKSNYLIYMIGILAFLFIDCIYKVKWKSLIAIIIIIFIYFCGNWLLETSFSRTVGIELPDGVPSVAWIAMGLQESELAPGWYNEFNLNVYELNGRNAENASKESIESIKRSISKFVENPSYAVDFFSKKTMSQWNNPTFQSFWINRRPSSIVESPVVVSIINGKLNKIITEFMNLYQSLILEGVLCYIIIGIRKIKIEELIFAVIFIGGFIFHLFWEAKAQYMFTYFVLLIPYAVKGYNDFTNWLLERIYSKGLRSL